MYPDSSPRGFTAPLPLPDAGTNPDLPADADEPVAVALPDGGGKGLSLLTSAPSSSDGVKPLATLNIDAKNANCKRMLADVIASTLNHGDTPAPNAAPSTADTTADASASANAASV